MTMKKTALTLAAAVAIVLGTAAPAQAAGPGVGSAPMREVFNCRYEHAWYDWYNAFGTWRMVCKWRNV